MNIYACSHLPVANVVVSMQIQFLVCEDILEFLEETDLDVRFRDRDSESKCGSSGSKWDELVKII